MALPMKKVKVVPSLSWPTPMPLMPVESRVAVIVPCRPSDIVNVLRIVGLESHGFHLPIALMPVDEYMVTVPGPPIDALAFPTNVIPSLVLAATGTLIAQPDKALSAIAVIRIFFMVRVWFGVWKMGQTIVAGLSVGASF